MWQLRKAMSTTLTVYPIKHYNFVKILCLHCSWDQVSGLFSGWDSRVVAKRYEYDLRWEYCCQ